MNAGILQLYLKGIEDQDITNNPTITFFKYSYVANKLFYKDDYVLENIQIKWNDNYFFKIQKDIEYIGPMWLKVTIPYFQIVNKIYEYVTTTTNTSNINEIIYDNHDTFLLIINSIYYLIPIIFLTSPNIKYYFSEIKFSDIKQYFNNIIDINIPDDTFIHMLTFTPSEYNNHIIPLLLSQGHSYDKLILSIILDNMFYRKNLLTQNSFDLYISNFIENKLINNYIDINKYDVFNLYKMTQEVYYYYIYYLNGIYVNQPPINLDLIRSYEYCKSSNITNIDQILKDTITKNCLILQFLLQAINPAIFNSYNFYKKFSVIKYSTSYNFILLQTDIIDFNTTGASNLINEYYPLYHININLINNRLPFNLTTTMTISTISGEDITYSIDGTTHIFTIDDTIEINLQTLAIVINTNNNTENVVDTLISNTDTNLNTEWNTNLITNLTNLNYNNNTQNYLFNDFKKNYYLKEDIIKTNFNLLDQNNDLKNIWIELKTIMTRYNTPNNIIGFDKTDTFQLQKNNVEIYYKDITDIQTDPQDLANVYAICINNFILKIQDKYFTNDMFLLFFYNKINSHIYQRYIRIVEEIYRSKLSDNTISAFTGLIFYYNIELTEYISKDQIRSYLTELFNITSIICYINLTLPSLTLVAKPIYDYTTPDNNFSFDTSCFNELKIQNKYNILSEKFIINENSIQIYRKFNKLSKYVLQVNNNYIDIVDYTTFFDYTIFYINVPKYTSLYLHETYISSIPYINITENNVVNDITRVVAYEKDTGVNLFEDYNRVNILFNTNSNIIIAYQAADNVNIVAAKYDITTRCLISDNLDKNYLIYNKIDIIIINLQCTYLTITDNDCENTINSTYPYIKLYKSSTVYTDNISKFSSSNTIKSNNTDIKIFTETSDLIILYCYNASFDGSSIDINIMDNDYLPNMYNYTSLNSNINSCMDYMIQKPFIIQLYNSINAPIYCIANIPQGDNIYINNELVYTIYQLTGDQLIRDNNNLYASHYYPGLLKNKNNIDTIESTITNIYDSVYSGIYNDIINIIEASQTSYYSIYNEILTDINNTDKYGTTIKDLYHNILPFNSMKYFSGLSSYIIKPNNHSLTNYDVYTNLAVSTYNFLNINNQIILPDTKMLSNLSNQFTTMQNKIINSPWQSYNSSFKLSPQYLSILSNYSLYGLRMLNQIDNNQSIFLITNHSNYPQDFTNEYKIRSKYSELVYNIERTNIELLYPNPWFNILQNTSVDEIWVTWSKDNKIVNIDNNNILYNTSACTFEDLPVYKTEKLNSIDKFSLIGAIQIKNKMIQLNSTYKINSNYIVIDNNYIVDTTTTNFKYQGINYQSKALVLNTDYSIYTFNKINSVYYYQIEQSNLNIFNINDNYLVYINNCHGYMKYTGEYLVLLLNSNTIIVQNNKMFYTKTDESDNIIFEYIIGNSNIVYDNIFIFNNSIITVNGIYNYYNDTSNWQHSNFIIFENNIFVTQYYSDYINILGCTLLQYNSNIDITIKIYDTTSNLLPPLYIDQYNISVFNPIGDINWIEYKDDWICIDNTLCQVKDLETTLRNTNINDGNYLLYYSKTKPVLLNHPDIFYYTYTDTSTVYNPYNNFYTTSFTPSTDYLANNNIITSVDNGGVYLFPQNQNIETILILQDPVTLILYNRPLIITNIPTIAYCLYKNTILADSYIVISPDDVSSSPILVRNITFFTSGITISMSTVCSLIEIQTISSSSFNIHVINSDTITLEKNIMITINVNSEIIILWLYIGTKSFYIKYNENSITEPHYIDISEQQIITSDMTIYKCDPTYFSQTNIVQTYTGISGSIVFTNNKMLNFEEMINYNNNITSISSSVKNIKSLMNWIYIDNISIDSFSIDSFSINSQYIYYIFVNNNLYYNSRNNNTSKLEYKMSITSGDMYVYPYEPMFIKCTIACLIDHLTLYLYTDINKLQRNEIIKIGDLVIIVNEFSFYYNCYIGTIISPIAIVPNIIIGYYSMGMWSNFYDKNKLLNNNKVSNLLHGMSSESLNFGDYYIDSNIFKNYNGESKSDFIFKFNSGVYMSLYKINNKWYYDNFIYTIEPNMVLYYNNVLLIVDTVNEYITFKNDVLTSTYINAYLPIQPFITSNVIIENNIIINMVDFTGWIEINNNNVLSLYKVTNLVISGIEMNDNLIVRLFNTDILIDCDFSNYYNLSTDQMDTSSNYKISLSIICNANIGDYVYFTQTSSTNYDFTNLKYCYNQYILVNSNHYRLINITPTRIYIDAISIELKTYQLIFSAGNINDLFIISNNHIINNSYKLDYPIITNSIKSNIIVLLSQDDNNISQVIDDAEIYYSVIKSEKIVQLLNGYQLTHTLFYENYIPITVTYNDILNFEQTFLSFNNRTNVLLQEVTKDNNIYQHYISFTVTNNNFFITSNNNFHSIDTSYFYLYNIISVVITKNKNIILNDDNHIYRPINLISRNTIISTVNIKTNTIGKPIKITDKWKYLINFDSEKFNIINVFNRKLYYGDNIPCSIIFDSQYYIISDVLIETLSYVYFNENQFINKMTIVKKTMKDQYTLREPVFNYISNEIIDPIKLVNRVYIVDNNYNYTINIADTILPIDGINYIGDTNLINTISIINTKYQITTEFKLTDVINNTLYNMCKSYSTNSSYIIKQLEISTSLPALTSYLNNSITFKYISYGIKPWKEWSLITTRYNDNLEVYLNKNNIVYDGSKFTFQATSQYISYFTLNETEILKTLILGFYQNNILQTYKLDIMNDLYKLELYLMNEITLYLSQDYFWQNTNYILKQIIENYNGIYKWTLYNNNVMIIENNILEIDLYPSNFAITDLITRTNYIFSEFDIMVNDNTMTISRNPIIIDNIFTSIISDVTENLMYGIMIDNIISSILNMTIQKNNMISTLPINYQYMDPLVYYISKMYSDIVKNETNKLNILTNINRSVQNYSTGKYNDYLFNTKYFSLLSQTKYTVLPTSSNNIYIEPYMKGKLNIYSISENLINQISTNNIFSYNLTFSTQNLLNDTSENIKSKNTYIVNVLDNYQHLDDIIITEKIVNTDSLSFYSNKIIEPIDIMVKVKENYNITNKILYGSIYNITIDTIITGEEKLYYNDQMILYISFVDNIYKIASPSIILEKSNLIKVILKVAIKNYKILNNKTYLILSDNITSDYNYIIINNIIYSLFNDNGYYIESVISIENTIYDALKFIIITSSINTNILISDISVDHVINPQEYNIKDPLLKLNFGIDNIFIHQVDILTETTIRLQYTGILAASIITHNYNMMQSIPYRIKTITSQNKYFYQLNNINSLRITDNIRIYDNINSYDATIYSIVNNVIMFNINELILINDLNVMMVEIIKKYILNVISSDNYTIYTVIPNDFTNYNYDYYYSILINDVKYTVAIDIINNMIAITFSIPFPMELVNITLEQLLILNTNTIINMKYNTLYIVDTVNDSSVLNASNIYIPVIQTLDSNMNEFNSKYYYKINNIEILLAYTTVYIIDSNNYISGNIIMIQSDYIIIGTNILIDPKIVQIYTDDFKYSIETYLAFTSYIYQKGQLLEQINPNTYYVLFNNNSLNNYNISNNTTTNTVIISFKYSNIDVINNSYSYVGFNKVPNKITTSLIETIKYSDVEWINNIALHLFNSIQLTIDENIIEKLDYDIYTIYTNYIVDMWHRDKFNKMCTPRVQANKDIIFFLPLTFRFTLEPSSYLPVSKMNRSNIKIKFNLCKMNSLILNLKTSITKQVYPIIDIHYDYIITNKYEPTQVEYILYKCLYSYQNFILNKIQENNHINLYNRTVDLYLITTTKDDKHTYQTTTKLMDIWYQEYLANNIIDFRIYDLIDSEINIKSKRYILLLNQPVIKNIRYAMYLDEKYLQYINENLNDSNLKYSQKLTILSLYFTYNFINKDIITNNDIINSLNIYINGNEILPNLPGSYLNNTIPYLKGYVLPDGYYMYSFAINSLDSQPNGMLNLKYIKDLQIYSTQNISNKEIKLKICTSEYRILKIENNVCKLI